MINFNSGFNSISEDNKQSIIKSINDGIFEVGHRSQEFKDIVKELEESFRTFLKVPSDYHVLFFQGGSSQQFHTINYFGKGAYITTGYWSNKTFKEYSPNGIEIWNDIRTPNASELNVPTDIDFIHYCSNETVSGLQFPEYQKFNKPVIVDCSSDLLTREINWNNVDMVYAHSQKNVGTVGVTVVIIKDSLLQTESSNVPNILSYKTNLKHMSIYNTAPVFNINVTLLSMQELIQKYKTVDYIKDRYIDFSQKIYNVIDNNKFFYNNIKNRSKSTITFFTNSNCKLSEDSINDYFYRCGMKGIKGHRSIGGYRLSITPALLNEKTYTTIITALEKFNDSI
jgi:phosphoserine aminotransferase